MARPDPIVAQNPLNLTVPQVKVAQSDIVIGASGRGGGGFGEIGGGMPEVGIEFFGALASGERIAFLFDITLSAEGPVFEQNRREFISTIETMKHTSFGQFALIYFAGRVGGGQLGLHPNPRLGQDRNPIRSDFRLPDVQTRHSPEWIDPDDPIVDAIFKELREARGRAQSMSESRAQGGFFVLGTQYHGALHSALSMRPQPETIYFMVEPNVAFPNVDQVRRTFELYRQRGGARFGNVPIQVILGTSANRVNDMAALRLAVNTLNGGNLTDEGINERLTFTQ